MSDTLELPNRRLRRRQESIEEILDVTVDLMAEHGVAGLSLGEVARQLGIRPPSLYVYFESKNALYDAVFARGARAILAQITESTQRIMATATELEAALLETSTAFVSWALENPVYSQLLFWRPVPGFEPSPEAYEPAIALVELTTATFGDLHARGWLRADVDPADALRTWMILIAGMVSQQLSNAPEETFETGHFTAALPAIVSMFCGHYAAPLPTTRSRTKAKGARNAHRRQ